MSHSADPERDLRTIKNGNLWPQWPFLPLKRFRNDDPRPEVGYIMDVRDEYRFHVYLTNMYDRQATVTPMEPHETAESIIEAGWIVD